MIVGSHVCVCVRAGGGEKSPGMAMLHHDREKKVMNGCSKICRMIVTGRQRK